MLCTYAAVMITGAESGGVVNEVIIDESPEVPFSNKTEWYKPEPAGLKPLKHWSEIVRELMAAVVSDKRVQAAKMLGADDVVSLSETQATDLSGLLHPDKILDNLVKDREQGIAFLQSDPSWLKHDGVPAGIRRRKQEIIEYRAWRHRLCPYLIKAVSLNPDGLGFHAKLAGQTLFVDQITPVPDHPIPMINMPIVAFLPVKPDKIYTSFTAVH